MPSPKIRHLKAADAPHLLALSRQAGWNQTEADWSRILALAPQACYGIADDGGQLVSTATVIRYARDLAWIGGVLTSEAHREKGYATALLEHAIKELKDDKVRWAKLDATEQGRPIYAKLGFRDECPVERWRRPAGQGFTPSAPARPVHSYVIDPSFDRAYFGAYRIPLLSALAREHPGEFVVGYGYAMGRPGDKAVYFGPAVVRTRDAARQLLERFLVRHPNEEVYWDLLPDNADAVQLAIDTGFEPARHLVRMSLACVPETLPLVQNNAGVFAIAGFEYG